MAALPTGGTAYRSMAVGDTLYVADGANGLLVYDISQPWNNLPELGPAYVPANPATAVTALDTYAYIVDGAESSGCQRRPTIALTPAGSYTPAP